MLYFWPMVLIHRIILLLLLFFLFVSVFFLPFSYVQIVLIFYIKKVENTLEMIYNVACVLNPSVTRTAHFIFIYTIIADLLNVKLHIYFYRLLISSALRLYSCPTVSPVRYGVEPLPPAMLNPSPLSLRKRHVDSFWRGPLEPASMLQARPLLRLSLGKQSSSGLSGVVVMAFSGSTIRSRSTVMETVAPELRRASTAVWCSAWWRSTSFTCDCVRESETNS